MFIAFGLSGGIPAIHYAIQEGWMNAVSGASLGWLILMGALYIFGALLYAGRIPERYFPGKCDIWVGDFVRSLHMWLSLFGLSRVESLEQLFIIIVAAGSGL